MTITLYTNSSEQNKIGKALSSATPVSGTLREETSILSPTVEIAAASISSNYAYIADFGRYYFITDIVSVRNGLWRVSMKCDVLETYKSQIYENNCVLARQENLFNLYLKDDMSKFTSDTFTLFKNFPQQPITGGSYILVTTG